MIYKPKPVRTPAGIRLGDKLIINGRKVLRLSQNGKQEDLLPEQLVELIVGEPVEKIVYQTEGRPPNSAG